MSRPSVRSGLIALAIFFMLLSATVLLYRVLDQAENDTIDRHLESIVTHIQSDLQRGAIRHQFVQSRMAARLALGNLSNRALWAQDVQRLFEEYPSYLLVSVLDSDLNVIWVESRQDFNILEGDPFPVRPSGRQFLDNIPLDAEALILETTPGLYVGEEAPMTVVTPIIDQSQITHWLFVVAQSSASISNMLSEFYLEDVLVSARIDESNFFIPAPPGPDVELSSLAQSLVIPFINGQTQLEFDVILLQSARDQIHSALPITVLALGTLLSFLLVLSAWLGLSSGKQARGLSLANVSLKREISDRQQAEHELEHLLTHDSLSGLPNRKGMLQHLQQRLSRPQSEPVTAVLLIDLDRFKDINETLGHSLGDELLQRVSDRLQRELHEHDAMGRLGGDEFLVVVSRSHIDQIRRLAKTLLQALEQAFEVDQRKLFVTASIGVAVLNESSTQAAELVQNADSALYKAKNAGRNQYAVFSPEMFAQVEYRHNLSRDLREALNNGDFEMAYQPVVHLGDLSLRGVEALLRWPHKDGYKVPPTDFVRAAEETGMMHRLGQFALEQSLNDLRHWHTLSTAPPWLSVNISGTQFNEPDFVRDLSMMLHEHKLDPSRVHLEITERVLIENMTRNRAILEQLDQIGMPIVVDDFGVGYSSLAYIKNFPISTIKIDRGFIRSLETDAEDQAITRAILNLSAELGMHTVAEGIEHAAQLSMLREYGCEHGQGFLFMQPVDAATIVSLVTGALPWQDIDSPLSRLAQPS
ncbi:MAG: bifunctional diguanylate cyclase/phosphodiesterase [Pseudomonadota bacterium]